MEDSSIIHNLKGHVDTSPKPILRRLMIPLTIVMLMLVGGFLTILIIDQKIELNQSSQERMKTVLFDFKNLLEMQTQTLTLLEDILLNEENLIAALKAQDRNRLLEGYKPVLNKLKSNHGITHFYFQGPDRVNILRVYKPDTFGDTINRFTTLEAERTKKMASGIELGSLKTITLRVVQPVFDNDTLIGYIEMGKEIEDILEVIAKNHEIELAVTIHKNSIKCQDWESKMRKLGQAAEWNRFTDNLIIYSSQDQFPKEAGCFVEGKKHLHSDISAEITIDGKTYRVINEPLFDASGSDVGDLIALLDISKEKALFYHLIFKLIIVASVLLGGLFGFLLILLRQTDQSIRAQQRELIESESRINIIMNSANDAILIMDSLGNISYWNTAAEKMLGYTREEAVGRNLHELIVPQRYIPAHFSAFPHFLRTGQGNAVGKILELAAIRKDKVEISVSVSLSGVRIGDQWHAIGIVTDITARKLVEKELLETNQQLEVATAQANSMAAQAEMANIAKSEFLANMSHEIRTPMNGVIGMTGLLLDTNLDETQRRFAEIVRNSGESLLALINDILDYSKIEAGKLDLEIMNFDLRAMLDDFAAMQSIIANEKGLEIICSTELDVPTFLQGDPGRLRQILTNLTSNAIKFTEKGEIAIKVRLLAEIDNHVILRFSIIDTGIGIPANKQGLLFQKFTQADSSTSRKYGGTGLGLAISKQLSEMMDGEIGFVSEEGKGSEFWFTVRLEKQKKQIQTNTTFEDIAGIHILVVDDSATNRAVITSQLSFWGVIAEEAVDGPSALLALRKAHDNKKSFYGAIVDMQMPGMTGDVLAKTIKADTTLSDTRLILMTSIAKRGDAKKMQEAGFIAYLTKPMRQSELYDCLSIALGRSAIVQPGQTIITRHSIREMRRSSTRILLVEDNIVNQKVALALLDKLGLHADVVSNGREAINVLETIPYDLVLMDVQMPEMDGYEATAMIRNPQSAVINHTIPIIAMTANAMQGDREKCIKVGMSDYISKPIAPSSLVETLEKWLPHADNKVKTTNSGCNKPVLKSTAFDFDDMMERLMYDEVLAKKVSTIFMDDMPKQINALKQAVSVCDSKNTELHAHCMKGAAENIGTNQFRNVATEIENAGKIGDFAIISKLIPELEKQYDIAVNEIRKRISLSPPLKGDPI